MPIQLRQKERTVLPTSQGSGVKASPGAFSAEADALRQLAAGARQLGGTLQNISAKMYQVDVDRELNDFQAAKNESDRVTEQFMIENSWEATRYDETTGAVLESNYSKFSDAQIKALNARANSYKTKGGKTGASQYLNINAPLMQGKVDRYSNRARTEQAAAAGVVIIDDIMNNPADETAYDLYRATTGETPTEQEFKLIQVDKQIEGMLQSRVISPQKALSLKKGAIAIGEEQLKSSIEQQAFEIAATQGYPAAEEMLRDPATVSGLLESGMKREDARSLLNDVSERVKHQQVQVEEKIEQQREIDRGEIYNAIESGQVKLPDGSTSTDIRSFIESTSLDEDEQEDMWQKSIKETDRKLKGEDIVTVPQVKTELYNSMMGILTGAQTKDEILDRASNARFGDYSDPNKPIEPTLNEKDYSAIVKAATAQYEQGYGQVMAKVNSFAEGILLKTDSLGFVESAPVRYEVLGDFQEAWMQWVASKGDQLKIAEIYPEGRRMAATFQISDDEAFRREEEINEKLKKKESKTKKLTPKIARRYLDITGNDIEEAKRLAAEDGYVE